MLKNVFIHTFGCQMNIHDSEKMLGVLSENGYSSTDNPENADLIIFNTCAIREKAEQKFYSQLGRAKILKEKNKNLKIAVAGCVAQDAQKRIFKKAPFVDYILGPQNIHMLNDLLSGKQSIATEENKNIALNEFTTKRQNTLKAWVSIMYGCNNFCSYCIVPYTRGREVSRPSSSIISEIRELAHQGFQEVTLLGQNVNSYRSDMGFVDLLKQIDALHIDRVRFVTSHPRDFSVDLINAMSELESLCEHIHLPLQSGSDAVLKFMNRRYSYEEYKKKIDLLRNRIPDIAITTDIIVGFPGETDGDYLDTVRALREIGFDGIFAFKYSKRKGTKACEMSGQIPDHIKSERLACILSIQEEITYKKNKELEGSVLEVLIEGPSETNIHMLSGRTRTNKIVTIRNSAEKVGSLIPVRIQKARLHSLNGESTLESALTS
ncbi:MAG: tRNA (N6-isopentenyl adenosine(37)-C2)-methylthiotransferase MiaB [Thermodesulfovibrionales bacterium]